MSVYATGRESLRNGVVMEIDGDVICNGYQSCYGLTLTSGENVYASGYQALYGAVISYVNDDIYCIGEETCKEATLKGMEKLVAYAPSSIEGATIYGKLNQYTLHWLHIN